MASSLFWEDNKVLMYGATLTVIGLLIVIFLPYTLSAIIGFGFVGLGVSCGAPILYAAASRYPGMPAASGLAIMNTYAMGGFLIGPVIIGFISDLSSLPTAFGVVVCLGSIGAGPQLHTLSIGQGTVLPSGNFTGTLQLWTDFYTAPACEFPIDQSLCPTGPCSPLTISIANTGGAMVNSTFVWEVLD